MAVMTEAKLRKIVREELGRQLNENYNKWIRSQRDRLVPDDGKWTIPPDEMGVAMSGDEDDLPGDEFYDTALGDEEEWVEDTEEEEEGEGGSAGEWNPWTGKVQYRDPVTGQIELDERRLRLLRRR